MEDGINPVIELTVVVPVRNEERYIGGLLKSFRRQTLDADCYEILVIDGMSEDATASIVRKAMTEMHNLRLLENPRIKSGAGRNIGVASARGSYVLFVDGHSRILHRNMLEQVLAAFARGENCLSRPQPQITDAVSIFQRSVAIARNSFLGHCIGSKIYHNEDGYTDPLSAGCGYRLDLYRDLGGVDESFDACEDLEFNLRVSQKGIQALHDKAFSVGYVPRDSPLRLLRQMYRYGYGRSRLARKHRKRISILARSICFITTIMALHLPIAFMFGGIFLAMWASLMLSYAVITGAAAYHVTRDANVVTWLQTWICFWIIHLGGWLGYLSGLVGGPSWNHVQTL